MPAPSKFLWLANVLVQFQSGAKVGLWQDIAGRFLEVSCGK
jgi:hypothetical protein